jgi:opacity protein-like surface antigen
MHGLRPAAALLAAAALFFTSSAMAADSDRGGAWEASFILLGSSSESAKGDMGSSIDFDSDVGWGFDATYNINQNLAIGFDAAFLRPKYSAVIVPDGGSPQAIDYKADVFNGAVNGTWNIMKGNFTPYIQVGLGWTHFDSNVTDGPPVTGCWWDPWLGYVCSSFYSTYQDTRFSWNGGLGLRYEFPNDMFMKASYNKVWIDGGKNQSDPDFDMWKLEIGWMFRPAF